MSKEEDNVSLKTAQQFMDIWQKQLSVVMTDPQMINMSLKIMQDFQKTLTSNQHNSNKADESRFEQTVDAHSKPAATSHVTTELLLTQFALSLQGFERRLSEIESKLQGSGKSSGREPKKRSTRKSS